MSDEDEYTFDNIATYINEMVDEAINSTMDMLGFNGTTESGFEGSFNLGDFLRVSPFGGKYNGSTFEPGGQVTHIPEGTPAEFNIPGSYGMPFSDLQGMVDYWNNEIQALFEDWWQMPNPLGFQDQVDLAAREAHKFAYGEQGNTGPGVEHFGRNEDLDDIKTIQNRVSNLEGDAILAFESAFSNKIDKVVNAQGAAACVAWTCVAGEQSIWERAQDGMASVAGKGRDAMKACRDGGGDLAAAIRVIGAIAAVAGGVATGGLSTFLGIAATGTGLAASFVPPAEKKSTPDLGGATPFDVLEKARTALGELSDDVASEEGWIADKATSAANAVAKSKNFLGTPDLVNETRRSELYPEGKLIRAEYDTMEEVANTFMRDISDEVKAAGTTLSGADNGPWTRPDGIGKGNDGGFQQWSDLIEAIAAASGETALSIDQGADALVVVAQNFRSTDDEVETAMGNLAEKTERQNERHGY